MRKLAIIIAVMVLAKVGYEELIYRAATYEVIVGTYSATAIEACQGSVGGAGVPADLWTQPTSVKLIIGKSDLDVYFWQVNHSMWQARYKNPYLFITARNELNYVLCEYDIVHGSASIQRM